MKIHIPVTEVQIDEREKSISFTYFHFSLGKFKGPKTSFLRRFIMMNVDVFSSFVRRHALTILHF